MDLILDGLNEEQRKAVMHTDGPLLVLAGAGSGKTRVITHRFAYLLREKNLYVQNILAVTFTNKAANEMKERIGQLTGKDVRNAWIRTFHSMGVMLLRRHADLLGYDKNFVIYDDVDSKNIIKGIMKELKIDTEQYDPRAVASKISKAKDALISSERFADEAGGNFEQNVARVYEVYTKRIRQNNALDFPDLIGMQVTLFRDHPEVRSEYHKRWRYVMIDEFQDTNSAQYELVKLITNADKNVCVVGDDDQSIYGWRGANIDNIYNFRDSFLPDKIALERNYRSTSVILEAANKVVSRIPDRMEKKLWTDKDSLDKIQVIETYTDREEAATLVSEIDRLSSTYDYQDFAVFYRTNAQSRVLEEALLRMRIPYKVFGGQKFYERKEIKDVLSYLKLIVNPLDSNSFERIVNVPKRKVGDQSRQKIVAYVRGTNVNYIEALQMCDNIAGLTAGVREALKDLGQILQELHESSESIIPMNFIKILLEAIQYKEYIIKYDADGTDRWSNVEELINSVRNFQDFNSEATVMDFLNEISLETSADSLDGDEKRNYVSLMTIHNAKGLEFPVVFITGVVEGLIPLGFSQSGEREMDEERRLFYVAITRAKEKLVISHSQTRMKYGNFVNSEPSPFLRDIPDELMQPFVGEKVSAYQKEEKTGWSYQSQKGDKKVWKSGRKRSVQTRKQRENSELQPKLQGKAVESLTSLSVGDQVGHTMFGAGEVVFVSELILKVNFERVGPQILSADHLSNIVKVS